MKLKRSPLSGREKAGAGCVNYEYANPGGERYFAGEPEKRTVKISLRVM